jgi:hypothetical protein
LEAGAKEELSPDQAVERKLREKVARIDFADREFGDVITEISHIGGLNCVVKYQFLATAGIGKGTKVNVHLTNVTLDRALRVVLEDTRPGSPAGYTIEDGSVVVSTRDDLSREMVTHVYQVADLLCLTRRPFVPDAWAPQAPWNAAWTPWGGIGMLPKSADPGQPVRTGPVTEMSWTGPVRDLMALISTAVDKDSWSSCGGGGAGLGNMTARGTDLVVTQTWENHRAIEAFLGLLRARPRAVFGVALVRFDSAQAAREIRALPSKACGIREELEEGEDKGKWTLDRCAAEECRIGDAVSASDSYVRESQHAAPEEGASIMEQKTMLGYEVGVLPKRVQNGCVYISAACESAWISKDASVERDTPESNIGNYHRHNVFEFELRPGQAKVLPVLPAMAKDGGVMLVVWAPK